MLKIVFILRMDFIILLLQYIVLIGAILVTIKWMLFVEESLLAGWAFCCVC